MYIFSKFKTIFQSLFNEKKGKKQKICVLHKMAKLYEILLKNHYYSRKCILNHGEIPLYTLRLGRKKKKLESYKCCSVCHNRNSFSTGDSAYSSVPLENSLLLSSKVGDISNTTPKIVPLRSS